MKFKQILISSAVWRGAYFASLFLLNIIIARYLQAAATGWIYYITNYLLLLVMLASLNLEQGILFSASRKTIASNKLASLALTWCLLIAVTLSLFIFFFYKDPGAGITLYQFIFFVTCYSSGLMLTNFFSSLFYARQNYILPNGIMVITNFIVCLWIIIARQVESPESLRQKTLLLFFANFLVQGIAIAVSYYIVNRSTVPWQLPAYDTLKPLFRYSVFGLAINIVLFLLYRVDYWFVKNQCAVCTPTDLGNYIQVSKIAQIFLMLPAVVTSAVLPATAAGYSQQVIVLLQPLSRIFSGLYLIILALVAAFGYWLFPFIYGNTFTHMYMPFLLLIPGVLSLPLTSILVSYNAGQNKLATNFKAGLVAMAIIIPGDIIFIPRFGIEAAALVSSIGYIANLAYLLAAFKKEQPAGAYRFFIPRKSDFLKLPALLWKEKTR
jgi:O-antigen/teichoic acid export membrane protein